MNAVSYAIALGALAPLAVTSGSWMLMKRTYLRNPQQLTPVMLTSFAVKMLFFGAYVAVMIKALELQPAPFVASFTTTFILGYAVEAIRLRRLLTGGAG